MWQGRVPNVRDSIILEPILGVAELVSALPARASATTALGRTIKVKATDAISGVACLQLYNN